MTKHFLKNLVKKHLINVIALFMFLNSTNSVEAQVQNNGILHVGENGIFYLHSGSFSLGSSSAISTSRTTPYSFTDGKIILGQNANTAFNNNVNGKFVEGYVGFNGWGTAVLFTGNNLKFSPIEVETSSTFPQIHGIYFNSIPPNITNKDALVSTIANTEYWIIKGGNASFIITWNLASNLNLFTTSTEGITIVGYHIANGRWQVIESDVVQGSTVTTGRILTTSPINLNEYDGFAIGEKGVSCFPTIIPSSITKTWNGSSWSTDGQPPFINDDVVLTGPYSGPSFQCYTLNLGTHDLTFNGTLEVVGNITGTGKIILDNYDGLIQHLSTATKPQIELTRPTRLDMRKFDYVYWGSPVTENVLTQLDANAIAFNGVTPNAFDSKYKYVSGDQSTTGGWQTLDATLPGKGFAMRIAEQAPFTGAGIGGINLKFTGTANNGDVEVAVAKVTGNDTSARNNNLLANPYPSAIDAEKFLIENNNLIDGVIYLWRALTPNSGEAGEAYTTADYIAYTKAGGTVSYVDNSPASGAFDGYLASGQGFKVRALASGTAKFTNCMRVSNNNGMFVRTSAFANRSETTIDRFRVSLSTPNGIVNKILVAYLPETSLAYDQMYDARMLTTGSTNLFSILDNDTQRLSINARPNFVNTDEVALGFTKDASVTTPMNITVVDREGVFANNQTPIYLHDTVLNTYHDFANGAYTFNTTSSQDVSRFKIIYQASQLGNQDITECMVSAYIKDNNFNLSSSKEVASIQIFDLTGRLVANYDANQQKTLREDFNYAVAIYVAKIKFTDGSVSSQKLINEK